MTYIVSEYTKISEKWFQLISRIVDLKEKPVSYPDCHSVCLHLTDRLNSARQPVRKSVGI